MLCSAAAGLLAVVKNPLRAPPDDVTLAALVADPTRRALVAAALAELAAQRAAQGDHKEAARLGSRAAALAANLDVDALPDEVRRVVPAGP